MTSKKKVLVVDDDPNYLTFMDEVLSSSYEVMQASDGEEGIRVAELHAPDAILLDMLMPKVSGIDMAQRLRSNPRTAKIPVFGCTGKELDAEARELFLKIPNVKGCFDKAKGRKSMLYQLLCILENPQGAHRGIFTKISI